MTGSSTPRSGAAGEPLEPGIAYRPDGSVAGRVLGYVTTDDGRTLPLLDADGDPAETEPATEAGRELLNEWQVDELDLVSLVFQMRQRVLRIEAEAADAALAESRAREDRLRTALALVTEAGHATGDIGGPHISDGAVGWQLCSARGCRIAQAALTGPLP